MAFKQVTFELLLYCKRSGYDASRCPISKVTFFSDILFNGWGGGGGGGGGVSGNVRKLGGIC